MATSKKKQSRRKKGAPRPQRPSRVEFHYIKGPGFRAIHVDGVIGGLTTSGFLHVAIFAERNAIPTRVVQAVSPDGKLGEELKSERESRSGVVRQMEADLFLNESTARNLRNWLDDKLRDFEDRRSKLEKIEGKLQDQSEMKG